MFKSLLAAIWDCLRFSDKRNMHPKISSGWPPSIHFLPECIQKLSSSGKPVDKISEKAQFLLKKIGDIRNCLSIVTTEHLIHVTSQLDCCNSLLYGLPNSCILKIQRIQNSAARILYRRKKFDHVNPLLKQLHWLPIRQRMHYKLLLLCFKAQHGLAPSYFQDCIIPYSPCRPLRTKHLLVVPPTKLKTYGDRSFNKAAPLLWNKLPYHIQSCNKLDKFKRHLKSV